MFEEMQERIAGARIIPVLKVENADDALFKAEKILEKKLSAIEITFRAEGDDGIERVAEAISAVAKKFPGLIAGAGTVINPGLAKIAKDSGAVFAVSPGFNFQTVDWCIENRLPIFPGVNNPSQIEWALSKNLSALKFFPAELSGGVKMLKAMSGPFPQVKFIPTGGVSEANCESYLSCSNVLAVGGTWIKL